MTCFFVGSFWELHVLCWMIWELPLRRVKRILVGFPGTSYEILHAMFMLMSMIVLETPFKYRKSYEILKELLPP